MKTVAKTIKKILASEFYRRVIDPRDILDDLVESMKQHWAYDLYSRRPGPALIEDGALNPTDLDLACFLSALVDRNAVINLPRYQNRRPTTVKEGEWVVSKDNRHGHVVGLTSNKDVFSFSVKIKDVNVVTTNSDGDSVGAFRNFMLVDLDGTWHEGWTKIEFVPSAKENSFLDDNKLWTGNKVYFNNFVHPNRWISFYGQWYLMTKVLVERLRAEARARRVEVKDKLARGLAFPSEGEGAPKESRPSQVVGESKTEVVLAFEAEVDGAEVPEVYEPYPNTVEGLIMASQRATRLTYTDVPVLNFACRATELAFARRTGFFSSSSGLPQTPFPEPFPAWISGAKWEREHKIKRTLWHRLVLHQSVPFTKGLALRYRTYSKSERVSA